jgi:hypothetical protein
MGDLVKRMMRAMPVLAASVLAVGCAASSTSSADSPGATASPTSAPRASAAATPVDGQSSATPGTAVCTSADLQVSLGGGAGSGMSQDRTGVQFLNVGPSACTLYGYPGLSWVAGAGGRQVGAAAVRELDASGDAETTVTLAPGALASAPLDIVDAAAIPQSQCQPVPVSGLRVYPPGEQTALFIALPSGNGGYGECSLVTEQPTLIVGYVQPGVQPGGGGNG